MLRLPVGLRGKMIITTPPNKALHQTRRGGVARFVRRGPVVEARLAGEGWCCAGIVVMGRA